MADEAPYSNELRLPISITLPRTPRLTPEGRAWPVDETGRDWPSRRGRPVYPVTRLPHGQAPGTGHAPPSSDKRSLMELFDAMDAAMLAEGRRGAGSMAARAQRVGYSALTVPASPRAGGIEGAGLSNRDVAAEDQ